ncbi:hypothetical protein [Pleionea sediminis]|uniref:hypothetical protein n=1 Tax=Pleionea sediminis TaxID=2569479 RepID=UPI0011859B3E|nr:hypothetical protein [Pleionea sediminis]
MTGRTVPLSVRVSPEDAEFLASFEMEGADTPSEKLRALISEARKRQDSMSGFSEAQMELRRTIQPLMEKIQDHEAAHETYSQLLHLGLEWIPEAMAELVAQRFRITKDASEEEMIQLERRVTDRVFRLIEGFLRLAVTQDCEGYDPQVIKKRLPRVQQLIELVRIMEKEAST